MSTKFEVINGVNEEWYYDDQIVCYTPTTINHSSITQWNYRAIQVLKSWPKHKPYLAIHNLRQPGLGQILANTIENDIFNVAILPTSRSYVQSLCEQNWEWQLRLAVVVSASMASNIMRTLTKTDNAQSQYQHRVFFNRESALSWLYQEIA